MALICATPMIQTVYAETEAYDWSDFEPIHDSLQPVDLSIVKVEPEDTASAPVVLCDISEPGQVHPAPAAPASPVVTGPRAADSAPKDANATADVQILAVVAAPQPAAALGAPEPGNPDGVYWAPPQGVLNNDYDSDEIQIIGVEGPSWSDYDSDELPDLVNASYDSSSSESLPPLYQNQLADPNVVRVHDNYMYLGKFILNFLFYIKFIHNHLSLTHLLHQVQQCIKCVSL